MPNAFWRSTNIPQAEFPLSSSCLILPVKWIEAWDAENFKYGMLDGKTLWEKQKLKAQLIEIKHH